MNTLTQINQINQFNFFGTNNKKIYLLLYQKVLIIIKKENLAKENYLMV